VLPATRQRWHSRPYPSRSWYSIKRPRRDARLSWSSSQHVSQRTVTCPARGRIYTIGHEMIRIWPISTATISAYLAHWKFGCLFCVFWPSNLSSCSAVLILSMPPFDRAHTTSCSTLIKINDVYLVSFTRYTDGSYLSKVTYPAYIWRSCWGWPVLNFNTIIGVRKLVSLRYRAVLFGHTRS